MVVDADVSNGGGAGICTYSAAVAKLTESRAFSGQTADGNNFRRLHRFLGPPLKYPKVHRIRGGILEATGACSRRPVVSGLRLQRHGHSVNFVEVGV